MLAAVAIALLLVTRARVSALVALYAIGVFSGFTMAGAGMVKHHLTHRRAPLAAEPRHQRLRRLPLGDGRAHLRGGEVHRGGVGRRGRRADPLRRPASGCTAATSPRSSCSSSARRTRSEAPILSRHVVVVLVDQFDLATARALQYARSLAPDDLRAVHFDIDSKRGQGARADWSRLGLSRIPLDIVECRDRRLTRAAVELVADAVADGDTECTVLLPRRSFRSAWQRLLHDRTADRIAAGLSVVPHVSATIVPFNVGDVVSGRALSVRSAARRMVRVRAGLGRPPAVEGPSLRGRRGPGPPVRRHRADRGGPVAPPGAAWPAGSARSGSSPGAGPPTSNASSSTTPARILLVFQGRPRIPGIETGARLVASGMVGSWGPAAGAAQPRLRAGRGG